MAVLPPLKIATTPAALLQSGSQGWSTMRQAVLRQVPGDQLGNPTIPVRVDAFEWVDVTLFGWGNVDNAAQQLRAAIQQRGSDLFAYALFRRIDVDLFGVKVVRYRMVLLHSFVELLEWAVAIMAIMFAAVIFIQYITTGQAPALNDLKALWGSAVTSVAQGAGSVAGSITSTYVWWVAALGGAAIAVSMISKSVGVRAPSTVGHSSIGVRSGGITARAGT